jgi:hypothetical protein
MSRFLYSVLGLPSANLKPLLHRVSGTCACQSGLSRIYIVATRDDSASMVTSRCETRLASLCTFLSAELTPRPLLQQKTTRITQWHWTLTPQKRHSPMVLVTPGALSCVRGPVLGRRSSPVHLGRYGTLTFLLSDPPRLHHVYGEESTVPAGG